MKLVTISMHFNTYDQYKGALGAFQDLYCEGMSGYSHRYTSFLNLVDCAGGSVVINLLQRYYTDYEVLRRLLENSLQLWFVDYQIDEVDLCRAIDF